MAEENKQFEVTAEEKSTLSLTFILAIFFGVISTIILWATKKSSMSEPVQAALTKFLNFELIICIASIAVNLVPILGQIACLGLFVWNLIICLKANSEVTEGKDINYPIDLQIIK